jgi:hypothetical protein
VLLTEVVQWAVLITVAVLLGWSPPASGWAAAILGALLGTAAFGGLGLLLAGTLPGLATLAVALRMTVVTSTVSVTVVVAGFGLMTRDSKVPPIAPAIVRETMPASAALGDLVQGWSACVVHAQRQRLRWRWPRQLCFPPPLLAPVPSTGGLPIGARPRPLCRPVDRGSLAKWDEQATQHRLWIGPRMKQIERCPKPTRQAHGD